MKLWHAFQAWVGVQAPATLLLFVVLLVVVLALCAVGIASYFSKDQREMRVIRRARRKRHKYLAGLRIYDKTPACFRDLKGIHR